MDLGPLGDLSDRERVESALEENLHCGLQHRCLHPGAPTAGPASPWRIVVVGHTGKLSREAPALGGPPGYAKARRLALGGGRRGEEQDCRDATASPRRSGERP